MAVRSSALACPTYSNTPATPGNVGVPNIPESEVVVAPGPHLGPDIGPRPLLGSLHGIQLMQQRSA
ncbi:hypothetical protein BDV93DRAFT_561052 [Ceratobasidium sp. AG-I]|nr:hypothetical protein BDV93DRAFT_561052 [Ceratobasidium sp. AG-I]